MSGFQAGAERAGCGELGFEIRVERSREAAPSWDRFAQRCGASFRCAYHATRAWQLETHLLFALRRYDILMVADGIPVKIGQFAVGFGRRRRVFGDGLQLLPEHGSSWTPIMRRVLSHLGPGHYLYGSDWSLEAPRQAALETMASVQVRHVRSGFLFAVDFSRWQDWDAYYAALSGNVRRNVRKASGAFADLRTSHRSDRAVLLDLSGVYRLRRAMFKRKAIEGAGARMVVRSLARSLTLLRYAHSARLTDGRTLLSAFCGMQFGALAYHLESASVEACGGAAWHLLTSMLLRAHQRSGGQGLFVMGPDHHDQDGAKTWEGLRRQRLQCRATPFPSSVVTFSFHGDFDAPSV